VEEINFSGFGAGDGAGVGAGAGVPWANAAGAIPAASTKRLAARRTGRPCLKLPIAVLPDRCKFIF
jgi:hypothetical protein